MKQYQDLKTEYQALSAKNEEMEAQFRAQHTENLYVSSTYALAWVQVPGRIEYTSTWL